ncbi:bifunctional riboflavin kinase/FAD synthetase [Daejeonella oryzae]|uniref:bifunctional riboflavin kinase/FAD synthetase n=1 Tax=Daejeonella oryzae TaxID=1122943 RepID=UPI000423C4E9|nr:bifunctional riboflavin kinase/FAD synthetase [Daejeonella oryzae]
MKIYHHIDEFTPLNRAIVTIGTFDGVHVGHQKIINRLCEVARTNGGESVILTFFPHPRMILHPEDENIKLISTIQEKADLIQSLGVDHLIITPFTRDFSNLSAEEYIRNVLVEKIGTRQIIIGYDHRFGKDRQGGLKDLQNYSAIYHFGVEEIPEQDIHDVAVSSTKIRNALLAGDVKTASDFLGYPFHVSGKVIKGDQIGRKIGFPTANLFVEETYKLIPSDGIYAVSVEIKSQTTNSEIPAKILKGMAYIGHRPTINGMTRNIEVNIFDFADDIYGGMVRLNFLHHIRNDEKFDSLEELKTQIAKDEIAARRLLE